MHAQWNAFKEIFDDRKYYSQFTLQASEADPNSLWEDEDTRSFYEGITDIKPFVPAVSYSQKRHLVH